METTTPETSVPPSRWKTVARRPAFWMTLLAIALAAIWIDTRLQISGLQQELARRLADSQDLAKQDRALLRQSQQNLTELQAKYGALESRLAETQSQAVALESMYQELSSSRDERLLAEVEQALSIAMQQLQFAGNVEAALLALQSADTRLARANQPRFLPLRKLLTHDIDRLRASSIADISGMSLKIESLITTVDKLPLAYEHRPVADATAPMPAPATETPSLWRQLIGDLWQEFRQLLRIQRIDHADPALLAPSQSYFLRENLKLRLLNARLALLQRDGRTFRSELEQTLEILDHFFDSSQKSVQATASTLRHMSTLDIAASLPRLVDSMTALRSLKQGGNK